MSAEDRIDIGKPKAWNIDGLVRADAEVLRLERHHAATTHGAETIRWFFLETITADPAPRPFRSLERRLEQAENSLASLLFTELRKNRGHLDDEEVSSILGYATDSPVKRRQWRVLREQVFQRIGLEFGEPPDPEVEQARTFDIGTSPGWHYDAIRVLDRQLFELAEHHAATDMGARTIRWYVWHELTARPRPIELAEIETQLESAEASLMAKFSTEARRARGHLHDDEVAQMVGFRNKRPIVEGYYRQLREEVFGRIAGGFGAVDLPELHRTEDALDIGRQGAWKIDNLKRLDQEVSRRVMAYARTEEGAQALRWHLLDTITADPEPVEPMHIDQRLQKLGASVLNLFAVLDRRKNRPFLGDAKIARFVGLSGPEAVQDRRWEKLRRRVLERIDVDDVFTEN